MNCDTCKHDLNIAEMKEDIRTLFGKSNLSDVKLTELSSDSKYMMKMLEELKLMVQSISENPKRRWEGIKDKAVSVFIGFIITVLCSSIFYLIVLRGNNA